MSDQDLSETLDRLDAMLAEGAGEELEAQAVEGWNREFNLALLGVQRGPRWPEILVRARALKARLDQRLAILRSDQAILRQQLQAGAQGGRALAGYRPHSR
jgi:hypothetical protein